MVSTARSATRSRHPTAQVEHRRLGGLLLGLELFVAVGAVYGGWTLLHGAWGLSADLLDRTPFTTWTWPGVLLLVVVAVPMTAAAAGELWRTPWAGAVSLAAGLLLVGWILGQVLAIGLVFFLQPLMLVAGVAIAVLAWRVHRPG